MEALKQALFKPLSSVLSKKRELELEIDPSRVYRANLEMLRFRVGDTLPDEMSAAEAFKLKEVRDIVLPNVSKLLDIVENFLKRIINARGLFPYGVRAIACKVYEMAQDRFPKASSLEHMAGVSNFIFTSYLVPAIIQPEAFELSLALGAPQPAMKRNLFRIATTLKAIGSLQSFDAQREPWMAEVSGKVKASEELMRQFYTDLTDVPELEDQRRVTMYMESTESRTPTRAFELNAIHLIHTVLYRHHAEIVSSSDNPLTTILRELGNMPDQLPADQNKQVRLAAARPRGLTHTRAHARPPHTHTQQATTAFGLPWLPPSLPPSARSPPPPLASARRELPQQHGRRHGRAPPTYT